ncbi:hypothetical protein F4775DRAFT_561862 [Biscogniauxia sp. FL1348]|nr:hypothetical protein F4775DRAFT_561862 [Biscogniauxia sp. FL1348]
MRWHVHTCAPLSFGAMSMLASALQTFNLCSFAPRYPSMCILAMGYRQLSLRAVLHQSVDMGRFCFFFFFSPFSGRGARPPLCIEISYQPRVTFGYVLCIYLCTCLLHDCLDQTGSSNKLPCSIFASF